MPINVNISNITGTSPYDIYICQSDGSGCIYIGSTSILPYNFEIPYPYDQYSEYLLKIIDGNNCIISSIENVPSQTPTPTPTVTPTSTITPTPTNTPLPTLTPSPTPQPLICFVTEYEELGPIYTAQTQTGI